MTIRTSPCDRLAAQTEWRDGHLIWTGPVNGKYGRMWYDGRKVYVHRVAWELENGPIPDGHVLDHDPACPKLCTFVPHLQVLTKAEHAALGWQRGELDGGWSQRPPMPRDLMTGRFVLA